MAITIQGSRRSQQGIRQRVQSLLEETPGSESLWGVDELNEWIYQATVKVWDMIVLSYEMQFLTGGCIDLVGGQKIYPLPRDFFKMRLVERQFADGSVPIQRVERYDESNANLVSGGTTGFVPSYRFFGHNIKVEPTPDQSLAAALSLEYVLQPQPPLNDKEELDHCFDQNAITLIIMDAVVRAKSKEEHESAGTTNASVIRGLFREDWQLYKEVLEQRHYGRDYVTPHGIQDNDAVSGYLG